MKCCRCPLYHYWSNESDRGESCAIFGDGWDSPFQYKDKEGTMPQTEENEIPEYEPWRDAFDGMDCCSMEVQDDNGNDID